MTTNYKRGYVFENKIVRFFRDLGFFVIRSAGSKGPVDVIAWDKDTMYLIQARAFKISPSELKAIGAELLKVPLPPGGWRSIHYEVWVKGNPKLGDWFTRHTVYAVLEDKEVT
jgi:hypothetical protein